jgi:hypothetical protein
MRAYVAPILARRRSVRVRAFLTRRDHPMYHRTGRRPLLRGCGCGVGAGGGGGVCMRVHACACVCVRVRACACVGLGWGGWGWWAEAYSALTNLGAFDTKRPQHVYKLMVPGGPA